MDRVYRASNGLYAYALFLTVDAVVLGWEAGQRLRADAIVASVVLGIMATICISFAVALLLRWGRLHIVLTPETLVVKGVRPVRRLNWSDIGQVREIRGPAYQLSLRRLLPGPYLPHGLLRGETVLELQAAPAVRIVLRHALIKGYSTLREDVLRSVPKNAAVDLHARWWHQRL